MPLKVPQAYNPSASDVTHVLAPSGIEVDSNHLKIGDYFARTLFIFTYPRFVSSGWFSPIINMSAMMDVSIFVHPMDTGLALRKLQKKVAQIEAELMDKEEKGFV